MENRQEIKRKSMGTVKQNKRIKLKMKEKIDSRVIICNITIVIKIS